MQRGEGGGRVSLIALTLPVTRSINHNYDKITQLNVSAEFVTATDVESDQHASCNNSGMCVRLFESEWGANRGAPMSS